jgi:hypothetical protein
VSNLIKLREGGCTYGSMALAVRAAVRLPKVLPALLSNPSGLDASLDQHKTKGPAWGPFRFVAERVGFEPTDVLRHRLISSQVHSTTLPPLREGRAFYTSHFECRSLVSQIDI